VSSPTASLRTALSSDTPVSLPLLAELVPDGIKPATIIAVEFDPDSQWFAVAASITARFLRSDGRIVYGAFARPVDNIRRDLSSLGVDVSKAVRDGRLFIDDWYTATLTGGRLGSVTEPEPCADGLRFQSLRVADFSVIQLKGRKSLFGERENWPPGWLLVSDSLSVLTRFNEDRPFLEWLETRENPSARLQKRINLEAFARDIHSESFYKRVEAASDGIIDIRVIEQDGVPKNFLRLRSLKGQPHDTRWHEIQMKRNGEAALVT